MNFRRFIKTSCVGLSLFLLSCGTKGPHIKLATQEKPAVCVVAVLPLLNASEREGAGKFFTRVLMTQMVHYGLSVMEEGVVKKFLERERCHPGKCVPAALVKRIGKELGVMAVVGGVVIEARRVGEEVKLEVLLWVRSAKDGRLLWGTYHAREGEDYRKVLHFGKISSLSGLAQKMADEIIEAWIKEDLFRCRAS